MYMKKFSLRALGAGLLLGSCALAYGVPANPVPRVFTQPDGTQVTLSQRGDEHCNYYVAKSGHVVLQDASGWYRLVAADGTMTSMVPSDYEMKIADTQIDLEPVKAVESLMRKGGQFMTGSSAARRAPGSSRVIAGNKYDNADGHDIRKVPTSGEPHVLVILVNFSDKQFSYCADPHTDMQNMMMQEGYSNFGATGSARDFYRAQSLGQYNPHFDVYGPVTLPNTSAYYAKEDARAVQMVVDATKLLDSQIDYKKYDTNDDGYVDNVYVFYAGRGQNDGGGKDCIWPHSWEVQYVDICPELDGVKISRYACSNELNAPREVGGICEPTGIGTFCHEFGHVLGQPDMYTTSYQNVFTPGSYSAMDHGSYNNDGRTPPNFSAYERYAMEWIKPVDIKEATSIHMLPIADGGVCYKITPDPSTPTEYWLFENRQQTGWDTYIPGHGMLVWHVDYVPSYWESNKVNDQTHQHVDIVEADGILSDGSRNGDTFPGSAYITKYDATTTPAFRTWTGVNTPLPISNITESATGMIGFDVAGGSDSDALAVTAPAPHQSYASQTSVTIEWSPVSGAEAYYVSLYSEMMDQIMGEINREPVEGFEFAEVSATGALKAAPKADGKLSVTIDNLQPSTAYVAQVYTRAGNNISPAGESSFYTSGDGLAESQPVLTVVPDDVKAEILWSELEGATDYTLTVATRAEGAPELMFETGFDNNRFPANWLFDGSLETRTDYCGMAAPSLRFSSRGAALSSWIYDEDIAEIDFWARVSRQDAIVQLDFYGVEESGALVKFATVTDIDGTKNGTNVKLKNIPEGIRQFLCIYNYVTTDLSLNIDDIKIYSRGTVTDTPVAGYDALRVTGNSLTATGLQKSTEYVAKLQAHNAAESSKPARSVRFTTLAQSGVDNLPVQNDAPIFVVTGGVLRTDADEPFSLYTVDGRTIATGLRGSCELPARGIYIVRCGTTARTIRY